jgi:hypothetical protein
MNVTAVEAPTSPFFPSVPDPLPALKTSLADVQTEGKRLMDERIALGSDLKHKVERCKPADRWSSKDLSLLQGCWHLVREAPAVRGEIGDPYREDCVIKMGRICFDSTGHGRREQTLSCPRAGTVSCSAPVVAQFADDGAFNTRQPDVICQGGSSSIRWNSRALSCRRVDNDRATCRDSGRPELGIPAQDQEFRRAR